MKEELVNEYKNYLKALKAAHKKDRNLTAMPDEPAPSFGQFMHWLETGEIES